MDHFITNSRYNAGRLQQFYGRDSTVIYPPVDVARFPLQENKEDFLITVSRLVPYKKVDLIAAACARAGKRLVVVGEGPELSKVKALQGEKLRFGDTSRIVVVVDLCAGHKALSSPPGKNSALSRWRPRPPAPR